jgi:nucleoside-diphosphate-sugar epimerase
MAETYFITGAQGCIGSWVVKALVERGDVPVVFDRSDDSRRLSAIISNDSLERVRFVVGEITDYQNVLSGLKHSGAQRVIHLAGLQVPTCKADQLAGAMVNVVGTLNVFEAVKTLAQAALFTKLRRCLLRMNDDDVPWMKVQTANHQPTTVYSNGNEETRESIFSTMASRVESRPLTVYGVNRDTGLTSDPTKAMKAAVLDRPFHIRFGGSTDFQFVADTAAAFIACADRLPQGASVFNLHGDAVAISQVAKIINQNVATELVTFGGPEIPVASSMNDAAIRRVISDLPSTPLEAGINDTMEMFRLLRDEGRLDTSDLDSEVYSNLET